MTRPFNWPKALHVTSLVALVFAFMDYEGLNAVTWSLAWLFASLAAGQAIDKLEDTDGPYFRVNTLEALLIQERTDTLWNAYNQGFTKDGKWCHAFMSDGEWLASEIGFDPSEGWYDDAEVKKRIPEAAKRVLTETV
jgi:hypothetical protein